MACRKSHGNNTLVPGMQVIVKPFDMERSPQEAAPCSTSRKREKADVGCWGDDARSWRCLRAWSSRNRARQFSIANRLLMLALHKLGADVAKCGALSVLSRRAEAIWWIAHGPARIHADHRVRSAR